ncbi:acylneuraminate cytidylyltransferase family protein [Geomonas sp. Red32]|uniref:acylneuraminate cytidylyltransferase family protein n=1 Tax=Geomonas sp. Red32 TaxID=2912856 RepID=UPI00202CBCB6|nr:acylneuraminate cytidylyltransferase family protein [Geomonas sp. Red32]MCM0083479.1 acylneuraminate cytidylyltransferase family protein [Geomonas sp. Red32]
MDKAGPDIIALITARGGSKGVPYKNIREVGGKPLIAWSIEAARKSSPELRVVVSTDDAEIAAVSADFGAEVPFLRPAELAGDHASSESVALHALTWLAEREGYRPRLLLLLQPTSPLRTSADIDEAVRLQAACDADAVVSVTPNERPVQWLRRVDDGGLLVPWMAGEQLARRQEAEEIYRLNGAIYLIKTEVLVSEKTFYPPATRPLVMPVERSLDIDSEFDLLLADLLLTGRQGKGEPR